MSEGPDDERRPGNGHKGAERPKLIGQAWRLAVQYGYTYPQIARELGVSVPTAKEYVRLGHEAGDHVHLIDIAKRREMSVAALDYWKGEITTRYMARALPLEKAFPLWKLADDAQALRLGLNAPIKTQNVPEEPEISPEVLQEMREVRRLVWQEQQEIERRAGDGSGNGGLP